MKQDARSDVLVIGSGPGGAVTACTLAEHGRDVLLLEEGPHLELESCAPFSRQEMEQKYRAGGLTPALGRPKIAYVEGCCVGGGSEINSGLYHRTPPEILDRWQKEFRVEGISPPEMEPHFQACEEALSVGLSAGETPLASRKLQFGADKLGWKALEVPRWFRNGVRQSMTRTFIPRATAAGCRILPQTRATWLRRVRESWQVIAQGPEGEIELFADTVFLAAGAIGTSALLRRSGITRNVGNTLAMHPTVKMVARFEEEVNHRDLGVPVHQVKEFAPRMSFGCSISSPPHLALAMLDHPKHREEVRRNWKNMAVYYAMISGAASGTVRVLPGGTPLVRYPLSPQDRRDLGTGLRRLGRLLFAAGARELYPSILGAPSLRGEEDLSRLPESVPADRTSVMTIHLFSSTPMGEGLGRAAVDSFGRVHGIPGLRIADAGLLPDAPSVNPQGSIMAIARRNALQLLAVA